ncbi:MAG: hypothetical protein ACR2MD_01250 [Aridibacter sp.]
MDYIVTQGLRKTQFEKFAQWTDLFQGKINADIIISGSSRAWWHYSPKVFEEDTKCSAYNLGMNGSTFYLQYYRYLTYLKYNKKPKVIIQNLDDFSLQKYEYIANQEQFLPYVDEETIINPVLTYKTLNKFELKIPFFRYIGEYKVIRVGLLEFFNIKHFTTDNYKGFEGQKTTWNDEEIGRLKKFEKTKIDLDSESVELFKLFLRETKRSEIKLVLVYSPFYIEGQSVYSNHNEMLSLYRKLAEENGILFLDYSKHPISYRKELYHNAMHLNETGAELFSKDVAMKLAENMKICNQ